MTNKPKGWPCHSSQQGLIKELLDQGITVQLTYEVSKKPDLNRDLLNERLKKEFEGKQRL